MLHPLLDREPRGGDVLANKSLGVIGATVSNGLQDRQVLVADNGRITICPHALPEHPVVIHQPDQHAVSGEVDQL